MLDIFITDYLVLHVPFCLIKRCVLLFVLLTCFALVLPNNQFEVYCSHTMPIFFGQGQNFTGMVRDKTMDCTLKTQGKTLLL